MYIYLITNNINDKKYVGKTKTTVEKRFKSHCDHAYRKGTSYFHRAIVRYGKQNFKISILEFVDQAELLNSKECEWIEKLQPEYNLTKGGDGGDTSQSAAYKIGITKRDLTGPKNPMWGGFSDVHKQNLSRAKKGKKPTNFDQWARAAKGKTYYHNKVANQEKRFKCDENIPQGWIKGRLKILCKCGKAVDISNIKKYHKNC
jgi:group I intron endonuclease